MTKDTSSKKQQELGGPDLRARSEQSIDPCERCPGGPCHTCFHWMVMVNAEIKYDLTQRLRGCAR